MKLLLSTFILWSSLALTTATREDLHHLRGVTTQDQNHHFQRLKIVQLGESYSAGVGARDESGLRSYEEPEDPCYRSVYGWGGLYARHLENEFNWAVEYTNAACYGALLQYGDDQLEQLDESVDLVLMTFGGNDLSFFGIVMDCLVPFNANPENCTKVVNRAKDNLETLSDVMEEYLLKIHDKAPEAKVVLLQYPHLVVNLPTWSFGGYESDSEIRAVAEDGDAAQRQAVDAANSKAGEDFAVFVDSVKGLFHTHEADPRTLYSNEARWIAEIEPELIFAPEYAFVEPFHPNAIGHRQLARHLIKEYGAFGAEGQKPALDPFGREMLQLSGVAAELSALAYSTSADIRNDTRVRGVWNEEPDQALTASVDGYCFAVFRGTEDQSNFDAFAEEIQQNLAHEDVEICSDDEICCSVNEGPFDAYNFTYRSEIEKDLRECAKSCSDLDQCVVLTGHSQGGSIANVAGLVLSDLNPLVITFGQLPVISEPPVEEQACKLIDSDRWFRYVLSKEGDTGLLYDPIPMMADIAEFLFHGNEDVYGYFYGHTMFLSSSDSSGVACFGSNDQGQRGDWDLSFESHHHDSYAQALGALVAHENVRFTGYKDGSICRHNEECDSDSCELQYDPSMNLSRHMCTEQRGSCHWCDEHADCTHGTCIGNRCVGEGGLLDNGCRCSLDRNCNSGHCDERDHQCKARMASGEICREDSDCLSFICGKTWPWSAAGSCH